MLLDRDEAIRLIVCPGCRGPLFRDGDSFRCRGCTPLRIFPAAGELPVIVDFSRSVLNPEIVTPGRDSVDRTRSSGWKSAFRSMLFRPSRVTTRNVEQFRLEMHRRSSEPLLLVVGGGSIGQGVDALYRDHAIRILAFDVYASPHVHFIADAHEIPLASESVDAVLIQAVLEHVLEPWTVAREISRVLKQDGLVYAETPFLQQVHEGAFDFTRFTESGHRYLFRDFDRIDSGVAGGTATQLLWSIEHFVRGATRSWSAGKIARFALFWLPALDRLFPEPFAIDSAAGVFFLGRKASKPLQPRQIIEEYRGAERRAPARQ